ncbi:hypothetical protein [Moorena producens]
MRLTFGHPLGKARRFANAIANLRSTSSGGQNSVIMNYSRA